MTLQPNDTLCTLWIIWRSLMGLLKSIIWNLGTTWLSGKFKIKLSFIQCILFSSKINYVWFLGERILHVYCLTVIATSKPLYHTLGRVGCKAPVSVARALCLHRLTVFLFSGCIFRLPSLHNGKEASVSQKSDSYTS